MRQDRRRKCLQSGTTHSFDVRICQQNSYTLLIQVQKAGNQIDKNSAQEDQFFNFSSPLPIQAGYISVVSTLPQNYIDLKSQGSLHSSQIPKVHDMPINNANLATAAVDPPCIPCQNDQLPSLASVISSIRFQQWQDINLMN
jgi:hypothetical protein